MTFDPTIAAAITKVQPAGRSVTVSTTITDADEKIVFNSASAISQVLPTATAVTAYKNFELHNVGAGVVTITTSVSGSTNRTLAQYGAFTVYTDGTNWFVV